MEVVQEKLGRREQKKIKARNEILDAAVVQFSEKGFMDTSVADIMGAAGMGLGTFYNYFTSKEDVLLNLLNRFTGTLSEKMGELTAANADCRFILSEMVLFTAKLVSENRYLLPLLFTEAMTHGHSRSKGGRPAKMSPPEFMGSFLRLIHEGQARGEFRQDVSAEIISEMFHSMFQAAACSHVDISFEENIAMKLKLLIAGISAE
ncbi:TetR/AcrR family transcriptional regulator [Anaerovibrio sp.]|uniref:TetR/AcrR family transcriptional regulator n=1 Tax=Anaerovibrio sp. TaxID=1872532 RepID=UPI0025BCCA0A|nr:TetR/AcrR family transcriptional regulator [Anaerovibrio sp.]MBR2141674.1 TetR/AcrR family transcriptional regulator [Anaerovibrio sp.]